MLDVKNIIKKYGQNTVVDNVSVEIKAGEFFSLLGPSGCGKTTLLRMIGGFENPTQGSITLNGKDISALPPFKRDVNTVFQNYALFPNYNVYDNIAYGLKMKKFSVVEIKERVEKIVNIVKLNGLESRMPSQLSGGQQQRVTLARALVNQPSVLLLDEPLSALDKKISELIRIELIEIQKKVGITFVFVTHNQTEALTMSDRVAVMNKGKIEQCGTPQEIYENPASHFVADFIGSINFFNVEIMDERDDVTVLKLDNGNLIYKNGVVKTKNSSKHMKYGVRPEQLKLSLLDAKTHENGIEAKIEHRIYIGDVTKFYLSAGLDSFIEVIVPNYLASQYNMIMPEAGEIVNVLWSHSSGILIDNE